MCAVLSLSPWKRAMPASSTSPVGFSSVSVRPVELLHVKDRPVVVDRIADRQRAVALAEDVIVLVGRAALVRGDRSESSTAARDRKSARTAATRRTRTPPRGRRGAGSASCAARRRSDRARASATPSVDALIGKRSEVTLARELVLIGEEWNLAAGGVENLGLAQLAQFRIVAGGKELALRNRAF